MPNVLFIEPGTRATGDTSLYIPGGLALSDATTGFTGSRTLRLALLGTTSATAFFGGPTDVAAVSFYVRFEEIPFADSLFLGLYTIGLAQVYGLSLTSSATLKNGPIGATSVTGTIGIEPMKWYRICVSYNVTNTTTFSYKVYVNGVLDTTANAGTMTRTGTALGLFACAAASMRNLKSVWIDNVYVDDRSDQTDTGNIFTLERRPSANGSLNEFVTQIGSGGSGYGSGHSPQVNEIPTSTANGWSISGAGVVKTEEYNIEPPPAELNGAVVVGTMGWILASAGAAENASIIMDGASSTAALTTSSKVFVKFGTARYPLGVGTDIGLATDGSATTVSLTECGVIIAYKLPPGSPVRNQVPWNFDSAQPW